MDVGVKHITLTFFLNMKNKLIYIILLLLLLGCIGDSGGDKVVEPEPVEDNNTPDPN
jgi:hypothetical protein|tara:strand:- start:749 stop:919 length:171 start_codon:yes stop_codon:yes gene_type:complete